MEYSYGNSADTFVGVGVVVVVVVVVVVAAVVVIKTA